MILLMQAAAAWILLMWIYFLTLKVTLEDNRLTKSSWLRTTEIVLDDQVLIRHRAEHLVLHGMDMSAMFAGILSQESTTHILINVQRGDQKVVLTSALKGISQLRDTLIAFETGTLLPSALKRLNSGEKVLLPPFEFHQRSVTYRNSKTRLPLPAAPELKGGRLHFFLNNRPVKISLDRISNPLTCMLLLTQGYASYENPPLPAS